MDAEDESIDFVESGFADNVSGYMVTFDKERSVWILMTGISKISTEAMPRGATLVKALADKYYGSKQFVFTRRTVQIG
jgi:hypothetical protein